MRHGAWLQEGGAVVATAQGLLSVAAAVAATTVTAIAIAAAR